jgi:predicted metal-binding protein
METPQLRMEGERLQNEFALDTKQRDNPLEIEKSPISAETTTGLTLTSASSTRNLDVQFTQDFQSNTLEEEDFGIDRDVVCVSLGPRNCWYVRWSDGASAWENIPAMLHKKLMGRNKSLPTVVSLSISPENYWVIVFKDGSFATSGFQMSPNMLDAFLDDVEPVQFAFAPAGGWILIRRDGSMAWERLPSTLEKLLFERKSDAHKVTQVTISTFGGWFVQFEDGECEWEAIPQALQSILVNNLSKSTSNLVVALSPSDALSYFICIGDVAEWTYPNCHLREALDYGQTESGTLPESVTWEIPLSAPSSVE